MAPPQSAGRPYPPIVAHPAVELLWGEPGHADVTDAQTVARLTLDGTAQMVARAAPEYASLQPLYLRRLWAATMLCDFRDFNLFKVVIDHRRLWGDVCQVRNLSTAELQFAVAAAVR